MEKVLVAQRVANKLFATENAVDAAILEASHLLSEMMEARQEIGFSAVLGADATSKITQALAALADARHAVVDAHGELADVKLRLGIRTKMDGSGPKGFAGEGVGENIVEHRRAS